MAPLHKNAQGLALVGADFNACLFAGVLIHGDSNRQWDHDYEIGVQMLVTYLLIYKIFLIFNTFRNSSLCQNETLLGKTVEFFWREAYK